MSEEIKRLERRLERLALHQREMEARLWTLEDSRVFRTLQWMGRTLNSVKARLHPGAEAEAARAKYRAWLDSRTPSTVDFAKLAYQPRFQVAGDGSAEVADYVILLAPGGRLAPAITNQLAAALQQERYEVLYGDEDYGSAPLFKPGWSPELLRSPMYLGRSLAVRRDALGKVGGFRDLAELAQKLAAAGARFQHVPRMFASFDDGLPHPFPASEARQVEGEPPLVNIVICSRNAELLKSCLDSIERGTAYSRREIVVVEHVSSGKPLIPGASYTRVPYAGSFNFADMSNRGARAGKGEVIVFLNDDVQPINRDWLDALVAQTQRPEVGAVGALLYYPNGSIQHAGIVLGIAGYVGHPRRAQSDSGYWPWTMVTRNVSAVTGACLAMRRRVFEKIDGFDLKFPVNYNDVDLCLRVREAGYQVIFEAAARLTHYESRTRARGVKWDELDLFAERWGDQIAAGDPYFNPNLSLRNEDCNLSED